MSKRVLHTEVCDLLDIEYPIFQAGMGAGRSYAPPELVAAVSNAGGLGVIGEASRPPELIEKDIKKTRGLTDKPFAVDILMPAKLDANSGSIEELKTQLPKEHVDFVERLKKDLGVDDPKPPYQLLSYPRTEEFVKSQLEVVLEERPPAFATGLGTPGWMVKECHARDIKVISLVGTVRAACRVKDLGADIIVAQGTEAGGHTGMIATMPLVPQVVDAVYPTPVLAAGGIADGRGLVAALALGAQGVWCGTAFLATKEVRLAKWQEKILAEATEADPRISRVLTGKTLRCHRNKLAEIWNKEGMSYLPMPYQAVLTGELFVSLEQAGMYDYVPFLYGQIGGMIKEIKPAKQVLDEMVDGAIAILKGKGRNKVIVE